jgi:transaldolase
MTGVGLLASAVGVAAALAGLGRAQSPSEKRTPARSKVMVCAGNSALDQLRTMTTVVADTGVLEDIKKYKPEDATTNPTLVLRALSGPDAKSYFDRAITWSASAGHDVNGDSEELVEDVCDRLAVLLGCDILKVVPGVVSTEVDARLSFNTEAMLAKGRQLSKLYEEQGYGKDRVLIKLASTWEAMAACRQLEIEGIHCNMTLVLALPQAVAAAEAGATLISPFVGRILDWYKKAENRDFSPEEDPGVLSVREIFAYYKKFGYDTICMGASFRSPEEVLALAGCDKMTISPNILEGLEGIQVQVQRRLDVATAKQSNVSRLQEGGLDEERFRWHFNDNAMATELLAGGIRSFAVDGGKLEDLVRTQLAASR